MKVVYKKIGKQRKVVNFYDVEKRVTTPKEIVEESVRVYGKYKRGAANNDFVVMSQENFIKYLKDKEIKKKDIIEEADVTEDFDEEEENYEDIFGTPNKNKKEKLDG